MKRSQMISKKEFSVQEALGTATLKIYLRTYGLPCKNVDDAIQIIEHQDLHSPYAYICALKVLAYYRNTEKYSPTIAQIFYKLELPEITKICKKLQADSITLKDIERLIKEETC